MEDQYSLTKILTIWALSAMPMALLAFVVTPLLIPHVETSPLIVYWMAIIAGLIWQFILSLLVLRHDGHPLNWATIRDRMRYCTPRDPRTGKSGNWVFLGVIPFIALSTLLQVGGFFPDTDKLLAPLIAKLPQHDMSQLATPENRGAWGLLGLYLLTVPFNYLLGEEFLYRGILLPKMTGVFGRWDWFANGVLFGFYHLHKPQVIVSTALLFGLVFAFPSKYFQSNWMAVIIHGLEGVLGLVMVLGIILGMA